MHTKQTIPLWSDLQHWTSTGQQPAGYEFAVRIDRCFGGIDDLPEEMLRHDWQRSFDTTQVIYHDERVTVDVMESLHQYLRAQCCDIENIVLVTSHCLGLDDWWQQRCQLYQEKSFRIKEWLFVRTVTWQQHFSDLDLIDEQYLRVQKAGMTYLFDSYGGTNPKLDRLYLTLKLRALDHMGVVDLMSPFSVTESQLVNHAMYLGYFKHSQEEQAMAELYQTYVQDGRLQLDPMLNNVSTAPKIKNEKPGVHGFQFALDRQCLATVCNETDNTQPWVMVSEKTLRPFWHHNVVVPNAYRAVALLESRGFWFPHDIIDYSYQHEADWLSRINGMISSLERAHTALGGRYTEYFQDNFDRFRHNARLLQQHHSEDIE